MPNPWNKGPEFSIVYAGTLGGSRRPDVLCEAVERLFERAPNARDQLRLIFAGHADRATRRYLTQKRAYVRWLGPLSFPDSMKLIRSADMLVLVDNFVSPGIDAGPYEFFPSKLLDYMVAQRPILAITSTGSIAREIIGRHKLGSSYGHNECYAVSEEIEKAWREWQNGSSSFFQVDGQTEMYDARRGAERLRLELEEVVQLSMEANGPSTAQPSICEIESTVSGTEGQPS
ncbi:glycosyltransferase [Nitratireductor aestuarii]